MVFKARFFSNSVCLDKFKEGYKKKGKKNEKSRKSESEDVKEEPKVGDYETIQIFLANLKNILMLSM